MLLELLLGLVKLINFSLVVTRSLKYLILHYRRSMLVSELNISLPYQALF